MAVLYSRVLFSCYSKTGLWISNIALLWCMHSCSVMSDSLQPFGLYPTKLLCPWHFSGKNTGMGCHFPPPGDCTNPGIKPMSPVSPELQKDSLPAMPLGKPTLLCGLLEIQTLQMYWIRIFIFSKHSGDLIWMKVKVWEALIMIKLKHSSGLD